MRNITKRVVTALAAASLAVVPAMGRQLTADEALSRALSARMPAARTAARTMATSSSTAGAGLQLVYTAREVGPGRVPAFYVFAEQTLSRSADGDGFIIASGDDRLRPVLATVEHGTFAESLEKENIAWWLSCYEAEAEAVLSTPEPATQLLSRGNVYDNYAQWEPIAPIVKTKWGQDGPFQAMCPKINGQVTLTGCLPTAMAQVIKTVGFYEGSGSRTLQTEDYSVTFDFGSWTPDFSLMYDVSDGHQTQEQKDEVAKLMLACGVAASATYGVNGTRAPSAVPGIINYMGYDENSKSISRSGYRSEVWEKIVYDELTTGRPVMYVGYSSDGHAFVCDGYSDNGLFHINWGWKGQSDGYFVLSVLNPSEQGAGASDSGYNFSQAITTFVPPSAASTAPEIPVKPTSPQPANVAYQGNLPELELVTNQSTYDLDDCKISGTMFAETGSSVSSEPLPFTPGFLVTNTVTGEEKFLPAYETLSPDKFNRVYRSFTVYLDKEIFSVEGQWTMFLAFKVDGYDGYWKISPWGGTPRQDHWLLTVRDGSKPGGKPYLVKEIVLADRLNPGVAASDYTTKGIYKESYSNYVEGLVTNFSGNDYSAKLRFGLEDSSGNVTFVGDLNYLLLRDGETRKLGAYFQNLNIPAGTYLLRLYVADVTLPFDDNYLQVEVMPGTPDGGGKGYGPNGCEIGFWEDNQYVKPYAVTIIKGGFFSCATSISPQYAQTINYRMEIYNRGMAMSENPLWTSPTLGSHHYVYGDDLNHRKADDITVKPDLPIGNYTMAFRNADNGNLLSYPSDFFIGMEHDGIMYAMNDDGKTVKAINTTAEGASLTSVTIPPSIDGKTVTTIGEELFDVNRAIEEVILPETITKVEANAFRGTSALKSVTFNSPQPPFAMSTVAFFGANPDVEMFVPQNYYSAYSELFRGPGTLYNIATDLSTGMTATLSLKPGDERSAKFAVTPADNVSVKASSSNEQVAQATISGSTLTIKAVAKGSATVTLTAGGGQAKPIEIKVTVTQASVEEGIGDINGDGSVNVQDVTLLVSAILSGDKDSLYDINGDKTVDVGDVTTLVSIILSSGK